jgi:FtsH-binding integral membrane protein
VRAVAGEPLSLEKCVKRTDIAKAPTWRMRSLFEMANWSDPWATAARTTNVDARGAAYDAGLRSYMLSVYNYMASGVLLTGVVALLFANSPYMSLLFSPQGRPSGLGYVVMFAPLGVVLWLSFGINRISETTAKALFWAYAVLMGLSLSTVLLVYTGASVAQTFFASAAAFGGLSLWGYTTKRDLSAMGGFLIMGVVGIMVAMLINMFMQSSALELAISVIGVLLFAGLTAYDTQRIKSMYFSVAGTSFAGKSVVMGALQLYLDFINMFLFLLRFMGDRR